MEKTRKILVTAALPYANGPIHMGHMVEYLQADFWARFQKMRGHDCRYFCADDTHGTPIFINAKKAGITPEELIAKSYEEHQADFKDFEVGFDYFSSTNTDTNRELCEKIFKDMEAQGHIATRPVKQAYCEHDKMFLPDRLVRGTCPKCGAPDQWGDSCDVCGSTYSPTELIDAGCSICGTPPVEKDSDHLFFNLNDFKDFLKEWVPKHNSQEVNAKLQEWLQEGELRDWDISRDHPYFGFEIPNHPGKYLYVWVDAPVGYIATSKLWCEENGKDYLDYWGEDSTAEVYHFIGKDIVYFHSLFWPAMLKNAGLRRPNEVFVHGFLTVNGTKMSKSKGTFINARKYLDHCGPLYLRYYYGCKLSHGLDDIDLNLSDFTQRVNSDLVGKFINLGSRSAKMLGKDFENKLADFADIDETSQNIIKFAREASESVAQCFENRDFAKAVVQIREFIDKANQYFDEREPWKRIKVDKTEAHHSLTAALTVFRIASVYLAPILPSLSDQIADLFNESPFTWASAQDDISGREIKPFKHLLKRLDPKDVEKIVEKPAAEEPKKAAAATDAKYADIKDFQKLDLRIGKIISAENVEDSDKLLRIQVDLGEDKPRTVFSGIKKEFSPDDIVGRNVMVVANLKPRKMKFGLSEGMILLAEGPGGLTLVTADQAKPGDKVE